MLPLKKGKTGPARELSKLKKLDRPFHGSVEPYLSVAQYLFRDVCFALTGAASYSSLKKSSSIFLTCKVSAVRTPTLWRIISVVNWVPSISTILKGCRSAKSYAGRVNVDVVTNTPLLAFAAPKLPLKALISGSLTDESSLYLFAWR